jgi:hypothetical protein
VETLLMKLEVRCTGCRGGRVCAYEWSSWYCRADELEATHQAEHGRLDGLEASQEWQLLLDDRPACDEETDCIQCGGTGTILTDTGRAVLA